MGNGDICTMEGHMQRYYQHAVLKEEGMEGVRINLTWRTVLNHQSGCPARSQFSLAQLQKSNVKQGELKRSRKAGTDDFDASVSPEDLRCSPSPVSLCDGMPAWRENLRQWVDGSLRANLAEELNNEDMIQVITENACHTIEVAASFEEGVQEAKMYLTEFAEA